MYYVLILNNGESYDDHQEWIGGVFKDLDKAIEAGKKLNPSWSFTIEHWKLNKSKYETYTQVNKLEFGEWRIGK